MSYEKGLNLELIIADLFRKNGYTVIHNLKKKGKSGVEHQIDVYAEYKAPLHTSSIIIEAKNYEEIIDKDKIMKFVQIVDDLNVDRGIFVTTSDFVVSAQITASQYNNVELWNRDKIAKLVGEITLSSSMITNTSDSIKPETAMVQPKLSSQEIQQIVTEQINKRAKGGFLGAGKVIEKLKSISLILYPYYDLAIKVTVQQEEKRGFRKTESIEKIIPCKVSLDAVHGGIIDVTNTGISYRFALPEITDEEARFLRICKRGFEMKYVIGLGLGETKTKRMINNLVARGILNASSTRPIFYSLRKEYPEDPSALNSIREVYSITNLNQNDSKIIEPKIEPSTIIKMIEGYLNARTDDVSLVYYPYYEVWYDRDDGSSRIDVLDGMSGEINEKITNYFTP